MITGFPGNEKSLHVEDISLAMLGIGSWEWKLHSTGYTWSALSFSIFSLSPSPDHYIEINDVYKLIHPEDLEDVKKNLDQLLHQNEVIFFFRIITFSRQIRHIQAGAKVIENDIGEKIAKGFYKDISSEKNWEASLQEKAEAIELQLKVYQRSEEIASMGSWQINLATHETLYSDNIFRIYGAKPGTLNVHPDTFTDFIHPDDRSAVVAGFERSYQKKIPISLEYRIIRQDGETRWVNLVSSILRNAKGEEILAGITQEITDKKHLETELLHSYEKLQLQNKIFVEAEQIGQIGSWRVDLDTRKTYYSDNIYRIYGLKPGTIQPGIETLISYVHPEDKEQFQDVINKLFEEQVPPNIEYRIIRSNGKVRNLRQSAKIVTDGSKIMVAILQDITEQKWLEDEMNQLNRELVIRNESFSQAEQTASIGNWTWNLTTNEIHYSDNVYRIYGLEPQSVPPGWASFSPYIHPEDREFLSQIPGIMMQEQRPVNLDYRIYRKDGELRYLRGRNKVVESPLGEKIMIGTTQDITEEVLLREQIKQQAEFSALLNDTVPDVIIFTDVSNNILTFNKVAETTYGVKKNEVTGRNIFDALPRLNTTEVTDHYKKALRGETISINSSRSFTPVGHYEVTMMPFKNEQQQVAGVLTIMHDISKEQRLNVQLKQRLAFIEGLVESSVDRIIVLDAHLKYVLWNKRSEAFYKRHRDEVLGKSILDFYPNFKTEPLYGDFKKALAGESVYIPPKDSPKEGYHESYLVPLKDDEDVVTGVLWIVHDLTERKLSQKQIEESRNLLAQTAEATPDAITIYDLDKSQPLYLNEQLSNWIGVSVDTLIEMGVEGRLQLIHPDDRNALLQFNRAIRTASDGEVRTIEYRVHTKQRKYIWIRNRSKVFKRDEQGNVTHVLSVLQDITGYKQAEEEINNKTHYLERIQDTVPDMISITELATMRFNYLNKHTFKQHGFDPDELYVRTSEESKELVHPDDRSTLAEYFGLLKKASEADVIVAEYRAKDFNDEWKWFLVRGRVFQRDEQGTVTHVLNVIENITERKRIEQQLLLLKDEIAQRATDKYYTLFNAIDEGFCIIEVLFDGSGRSVDYRFLEINPGFIKQTGLENAVGKTMKELAPQHEAFWFEVYGEIAKTGEPKRFEHVASQIAGGVWYDVYAFRIGAPEHRQVAILFNDITDRKRRELQQLGG